MAERHLPISPPDEYDSSAVSRSGTGAKSGQHSFAIDRQTHGERDSVGVPCAWPPPPMRSVSPDWLSSDLGGAAATRHSQSSGA